MRLRSTKSENRIFRAEIWQISKPYLQGTGLGQNRRVLLKLEMGQSNLQGVSSGQKTHVLLPCTSEAWIEPLLFIW